MEIGLSWVQRSIIEWDQARKRPFNRLMPELERTRAGQYAFIEYLEQRHLSSGLALINGWYPSKNAGDSALRIVIPATTGDRRNVFWQARAVGNNQPRYQSPHAPRGDAIIVVWPESRLDIEDRFNIFGSVIAEGPMDALAAAEIGYLGVSLMGSSPPEDSLLLATRFIKSCGGNRFLVGDTDSPWHMTKLVGWFANQGVGIRFVLPSPRKDLADCSPDERRKLLV